MVSHTDIRQALFTPSLIDTKFLMQPEVIDSYEIFLQEFFSELKQRFQAIVHSAESDPTFQTFIEPYLLLEEELWIAWSFLSNMSKVQENETLQSLIETFSPVVAQLQQEWLLDEKFYKSLLLIQKQNLDALQKRSLALLLQDRELAGVKLPADHKKRLQEINQELQKLGNQYERNVIDSQKEFFLPCTEKDIELFPDDDKKRAMAEGEKRGLSQPVLTLDPGSFRAALRYCGNPDIRKAMMCGSYLEASEEPYDNHPIILQMLRLRQEKAKILGYKDFVELTLQKRMERDSTVIVALLQELVEQFRKKAALDLQQLRGVSGMTDLQLWDVPFAARIMKKKSFDLDDEEVRQYFPFDQTINGLFTILREVFGVDIKPSDAHTYDNDVKVFDVQREKKLIAHILFDPFAKPGKLPGAWCTCIRKRFMKDGVERVPVIFIATNVSKGSTETLLTLVEVETVFHEFGHGLHNAVSMPLYPNLHSENVEWDFCELPSQFLENWCWNQEALALFAKHAKTGNALPKKLFEKLQHLKTFLSGYMGLGQMEYALLDLALHSKAPPQTAEELDAMVLENAKHFSPLPLPDFYKKHCSFLHLFTGGYGDYAAGYYSYVWAELLEADAFDRFENEGVMNAQLGTEYLEKVLAPGAGKPGMELFEGFRKRPPRPQALAKKYGL